MRILSLSAFLTASMAFSAHAQPGRVAVDLSGGTIGGALQAQVGVTDWLALRGGYNYLEFTLDDEEFGDVVYDTDVDLSGFGAFADLHPLQNGFTVTGGAFFGERSVDLDGTPSEPVEIGGEVYSPAEVGTLQGEAVLQDPALYAGLGWDSSLYSDSRWSFIARAGVMLADETDVELRSEGGLLSESEEFLAQLEEEEQSAEDDINDFAYYPVVTIGVGYRF